MIRARPPALHVLLVRAGALGDLVLLRRAIAALRASGRSPSLLAPASPAAALVGRGGVEEVLPWDGPEMAALLAGESTSGPVATAIGSADAVVAFTRSEAALAALGRLSRRLVARDPTPPAGGPHSSRWLAGALEALGIDSRPEPPPLGFTETERRDAERRTHELPVGFLAIHPGSGSRLKNWPFDRFADAARRLSPGRPWLLVLGPAEGDLAQPPGARLARDLPLRALGAVLARAGLFIGNDSGVAHLAAACGTKTLALFGPTDPALWAPVGGPVATLRPSSGNLADLPVDDVAAAALALRAEAAVG
jgi:ADP-heptose:LPS heptosyltransferase